MYTLICICIHIHIKCILTHQVFGNVYNCNVLQCDLVCWSVWECVGVYWSVLQCPVVCCSVLQCVAYVVWECV